MPSEIHWHRNIIRLKTKLAMTGHHTDYRSVGSLWCLTGRFAWLRWQCHDIAIAGGSGEWFCWPSRDGVHNWMPWGPVAGIWPSENKKLHQLYCFIHQVAMCMTQILILCWAAWKYMQHLYQSHLNHNNTILLNQQIIFFTLHHWRFFTNPLGISIIYHVLYLKGQW